MALNVHRDDDKDDDAVDEVDEDDVQLEHPKNDARCCGSSHLVVSTCVLPILSLLILSVTT